MRQVFSCPEAVASWNTGRPAAIVKSVLPLSLLLLSTLAAAGDSRSVRFQHISRDMGLSQSFVYSIVQDRQGYLWFGTQEGLNRFDGFDFTVFAHDPADAQSISDETIRTMIEDRSGTLWVGTDAGGLSRYNRAHQTFTNYLHDPADANSISDNRVRVIYKDNRGTLWIGTDGAGLDSFDPASETFRHYPHDPARPGSLSNNHVWSILEDSNSVLWVATDNGLNRLDPATGSFTYFMHDPDDASSISDNQLRVLYEDRDKALWIGTETGGLNRIDRDSGSFERFVNDPADAASISSNRINAMLQDDAGVMWIGTVKGLNAWNPNTRSFNRYLHDPANQYSLSQDTVHSIFQDRGGVLWIGTYDGLSLWNQATRAMLHYRNDANDTRSLNQNTVTSFAEDKAGNVWVGTFGGGLNLLDRSSDRFLHLRHSPDDDTSLSSDRIMAVRVDSEGVLWAGTRAAGLNRFDDTRNSFEHFRHDPQNPASLSSDGISYILEDSRESLWIATFGGGLNFFDRDTQQFRHYRHDPDRQDTLSNDRILVLFEDSAGNLWIGTYGGGLNRFDPGSGTFTRFRADPDQGDSLSGDEIYMIQEDAKGDLWIGVKGSGLNRWRQSDRKAGKVSFQHFTELDGLPSSTIYSGLWDQAGGLWLSTSRGLSRLDVETLQFRNYDTSHGLQGDEFNLAAGFAATDGCLFFGGLNGFNAFLPDLLSADLQPPPQVVITKFLSLNSPVDLGDTQIGGEPVQLKPDQNVIGFEFAALDFAAPAKNRFMYQLQGIDQDWVDAGTKRQVTYTNLPAGNYTFRVKASNNNGVWSEQDAALDLRMNPAAWKTWWAYLAYFLVAAVLVLAAFRIHRKRIQQAAKLEHAEELGTINRALQDEVVQRKANEIAAQSEKERAQRYFDVADVILLIVDDQNRVVLINNKGCELLGRRQTEIIGSRWLDFVPEESRQQVHAKLATISHPEIAQMGNYLEHSLIAADGQQHMIGWRFTALLYADDSSTALCSGMDVTQERNLENQLKFHEKMSAIATLTGGIAHDFNNLNTVVMTATNMLRSSASDRLTESELALIDDSLKAAESSASITQRLLAFSHEQVVKPEVISVTRYFEDVEGLIERTVGDGVVADISIATPDLALRLDTARFTTAIINLAANARDAMSGQGPLLISVDRFSIDRRDTSWPNLEPGNFIQVIVKDAGKGMTADEVSRAFEPFFSTKQLPVNSGLGLSMVYGFVKQSGGDIRIVSKADHGTSIIFVLPEFVNVVLDAVTSSPAETRFDGRSVLLVEDHDQVRRVTKLLLQNLGFVVTSTANADDAVELISSGMQPDVMLSDFRMPGSMDGCGLAKWVNERHPDIGVVIASGILDTDTALPGNTVAIAKPYSNEELCVALQDMLRHHDTTNQHR